MTYCRVFRNSPPDTTICASSNHAYFFELRVLHLLMTRNEELPYPLRDANLELSGNRSGYGHLKESPVSPSIEPERDSLGSPRQLISENCAVIGHLPTRIFCICRNYPTPHRE